MLGTFQQSTLRIPIEASQPTISRCLTELDVLKQWVWPQTIVSEVSDRLSEGSEFDTLVSIGNLNIGLPAVTIGHRVTELSSDRMVLLVWGAVDGWNLWSWGDGWVQLKLEGVSLLPLGLGQSFLLGQFQQVAQQTEAELESRCR